MTSRLKGPLSLDNPSPCKSCPYRKDVAPDRWHTAEFLNLLKQDNDPMQGSIFGCHEDVKKETPRVCAGWLIDQKKRGFPCIQLRLKLLRTPNARELLDQLNDGGAELYPSIRQMVQAHLSAVIDKLPEEDSDPSAAAPCSTRSTKKPAKERPHRSR